MLCAMYSAILPYPALPATRLLTALKGGKRERVRSYSVKFSDEVECQRMKVNERMKSTREFRATNVHTKVGVPDPVDSKFRLKADWSHAIARSRAIELATWNDEISENDPEEWKGVKPNHPEDCRDRPMVWSDNEVYIFELDRTKDTKNAKPHQPLRFVPVGMPKKDALRMSDVVNGHFHNIGKVPDLGGHKTVFLSEPVKAMKLVNGSLVEVGEGKAAAARARDRLLDLWLVDTGCGHDLVNMPEASRAGCNMEEAKRPMYFQTANGTTATSKVAPIYISELGEEIHPHVLKETPPVVTVGRRTMSEGYSFVWCAGANPYFLTPIGTKIELEVIGDIPYLRRGSPLCSPSSITEDDLRVRHSVGAQTEAPKKGVKSPALPGVEEGHPPEGEEHPSEEDVPAPPDPPEGPSRKEVRDLAAEALTLEHQTTHKPVSQLATLAVAVR